MILIVVAEVSRSRVQNDYLEIADDVGNIHNQVHGIQDEPPRRSKRSPTAPPRPLRTFFFACGLARMRFKTTVFMRDLARMRSNSFLKSHEVINFAFENQSSNPS